MFFSEPITKKKPREELEETHETEGPKRCISEEDKRNIEADEKRKGGGTIRSHE